MRMNVIGGKLQNINYMAPELLSSDHLSTAGDLWAIGIIMYTLVINYKIKFSCLASNHSKVKPLKKLK